MQLQAGGWVTLVDWELAWTLSMNTCSNHILCSGKLKITRCFLAFTRVLTSICGEGMFKINLYPRGKGHHAYLFNNAMPNFLGLIGSN